MAMAHPLRAHPLRTLRHAARMTLQELADKCGITRSAVCRHENGSRRIDDDTAEKYARALGVKVGAIER